MPYTSDEDRRAHARMRYAERMANDPEWAAKWKQKQAESYQKRKQKDPEYVERRKAQFKRWYDFRGKEAARKREGYLSREEWLAQVAERRKERREQYRSKGSRHTPAKVLYDQVYDKQKGCCAICGTNKERDTPHQRLIVDHCHATGKFRALLCHSCNVAIGHFREDIDTMKKAIRYLRKHNAISP